MKLLFWMSCKLARFADMIIVNSFAGRDFHVQHGYPAEKIRVIPNGIDTDTLRPSEVDRASKRAEWGVGDHEILIGMVGRLDPMKDYPTFLHAAALLSEQHDHVRFVCVGHGDPEYTAKMRDLAEALKLRNRLIWAGIHHDMQAVYNAFDISVLSSCGEGFPNVVGEAMACGKVCVVTDVGDAARIVGDTGRVVPPGDPQRLSDAITEVIGMSKEERMDSEHRARYRIVEHFGVNALLDRTLDAVGSLVGW
jgi:glycosyltransferase involved in cell wall biosynthesis